jgi:hypothetical protein
VREAAGLATGVLRVAHPGDHVADGVVYVGHERKDD